MNLRRITAFFLSALLLVSVFSVPSQASDISALSLPLDSEQMNSIHMLNRLVVLTEEISASGNSRLYLEEAYSSLLNNTAPEAVDARTQEEISLLLDTLEGYRMLADKRERLEYIYEQNKAQAIRDAVPARQEIVGEFIESFKRGSTPTQTMVAFAFMGLDSASAYASSMAAAHMEYLQDGWALDDTQAAALHALRKNTFAYMVETVRAYSLPGSLTLTEQSVEDFVAWKNKTNPLQVIQFFEANQQTYEAFGPYWLALSKSYFENGEWEKCLSAFETYRSLNLKIFRLDHDLADIIPLAVTAARQVYGDAEYARYAAEYLDLLCANTHPSDWSLRYFAAHTLVELYAVSKDTALLIQAYDLLLSNVNYLLDEQKTQNAAYLAPVVKHEVPDGASDEQEKEIKSYNKYLAEERKIALPPVYEPLLLNCDLLFALSAELNLSQEDIAYLDGILHENGSSLFLVPALDNFYRFSAAEAESFPGSSSASFARDPLTGATLTLPAFFLTDAFTLSATVSQNGEQIQFNDWKLKKVERPKNGSVSDFVAEFQSETAGDFDFAEGCRITFTLQPHTASSVESLTLSFEGSAAKAIYVFDTIVFEQVNP